jgi:hypothetical protein
MLGKDQGPGRLVLNLRVWCWRKTIVLGCSQQGFHIVHLFLGTLVQRQHHILQRCRRLLLL